MISSYTNVHPGGCSLAATLFGREGGALTLATLVLQMTFFEWVYYQLYQMSKIA